MEKQCLYDVTEMFIFLGGCYPPQICIAVYQSPAFALLPIREVTFEEAKTKSGCGFWRNSDEIKDLAQGKSCWKTMEKSDILGVNQFILNDFQSAH